MTILAPTPPPTHRGQSEVPVPARRVPTTLVFLPGHNATALASHERGRYGVILGIVATGLAFASFAAVRESLVGFQHGGAVLIPLILGAAFAMAGGILGATGIWAHSRS